MSRPAEGARVAERPTRLVDLEIGGMTCASCAARVERRLNRLDGVHARVNLATERARVEAPAGVADDDLVAAVVASGYSARLPETARPDAAEPSEPPSADRARLVVASVLSTPVIALSMIPALQFDSWQWLALGLAAPVVTWAAWPFYVAAARAARHASATMDTLVSIGIVAASAWSAWALLATEAGDPGMRMRASLLPSAGPGHPEIYLEVATAVTTFLLAGRAAEARARFRAGTALRALLALHPRTATLLPDGIEGPERTIPADRLAVGDLFVVRPGERIATDGDVVAGHSAVQTAPLTGEPVPVDAEPGAAVTGGCLNTTGRLVIRATRVGADTALARITRLVEDAQTGRSPVQRLVDRVSAVFVPVVLGLALATLAGWLLAGEPDRAITAAVAVLIIACPCALGLATPTALLVGTGRGAELGILVTGPEVLERSRRADVVLLDKTGTLTEGRMTLDAVIPGLGADPGEHLADAALAAAAAVESGSEHAVGAAIVAAAGTRFGRPPEPVGGFDATPGRGVSGTVGDRFVAVGRPGWLAEHGMALPTDLAEALARAEGRGHTAVVVGWSGAARAVLALADRVRPQARDAVAGLRGLGLRPVLVTGDNAAAAGWVAQSVGIDATDVVAGVLPEAKLDVVRRYQAEGHVVAMLGDGVNDAAAMAGADLGMAMGGGTDVAIEASDVTLVRDDPRAAAEAIRLCRATLRTIRQNLGWAFGYNVAAIPLAAAGVLNPLIAGAAMAASSLLVVSNSLRLRRFRAPSGPAAPR